MSDESTVWLLSEAAAHLEVLSDIYDDKVSEYRKAGRDSQSALFDARLTEVQQLIEQITKRIKLLTDGPTDDH